jgi:hypothetical protein
MVSWAWQGINWLIIKERANGSAVGSSSLGVGLGTDSINLLNKKLIKSIK